jgi:hypothetical protein
MEVDVMNPAYNIKHQYSVTMLTGEDWTKANDAPAALKGLIRFTDGLKMSNGLGYGVYRQSVGRSLSLPWVSMEKVLGGV